MNNRTPAGLPRRQFYLGWVVATATAGLLTPVQARCEVGAIVSTIKCAGTRSSIRVRELRDSIAVLARPDDQQRQQFRDAVIGIRNNSASPKRQSLPLEEIVAAQPTAA